MKTLGEQFRDAMASERFAEAIRDGALVFAADDCFEEVRRLCAEVGVEVRPCHYLPPGCIYTVKMPTFFY